MVMGMGVGMGHSSQLERDRGLDECTAIRAHQGGQRNHVAPALFDGCESRQWTKAWPGDLAKGRR